MDEMTLLREFRSDAPAAAPAAVREQALGRPSTRRRPALRLAVAAALAVTGGGVAATVLTPSSPSAATVLGHAAQYLLEADPGPTPTPHQWVYTLSSTVVDYGDQAHDEPTPWASWVRMDGDGYAEIDPETNRLHVQTGDFAAPIGTPEQWSAVGRSLPEDPQGVLQALRDDPLFTSDAPTQPDRDFDEVSSMLLTQGWLAPSTVARLYQALATIPGVGIDDDAPADLAGRPVLSVTFDGDISIGRRGDRWELLLDPQSFQVLGLRGTAGQDYHDDKTGLDTPEGTVWYQYLVYRTVLVDHAGERS